MVTPIEVAGRRIGPGEPCFIIAEAGVNHNGKIESAKRLVDRAAEAGADSVKFQTFRADRLASDQTRTMLKQLELSERDHRELLEHCRKRGIQFLSTPFEEESADFLEQLGVAAFKIPSGEVTNLSFLSHLARKGKPLILSTGMSTLEEVEEAVRVIRETGNRKLVLLHCVSRYPADPKEANLRAMVTMGSRFSVPIGYSDHTLGSEVALAAVALGACVIEKHFTLDRNLPGPDHRASLEPAELAALVKGIRVVESALGHGRKEPSVSEAETARIARKSLVALRDIPAGTSLTRKFIGVKRPGDGLPPSMLTRVIGQIAKADIPADTLLTLEMLTRGKEGLG
ncbi:MAG: N-acetylneuraminate synthase [Candidatus Omnitrophica bacterium]|nr:N-acetylneuraminate synthase [Candidatus Omnitrophota bacterium]